MSGEKKTMIAVPGTTPQDADHASRLATTGRPVLGYPAGEAEAITKWAKDGPWYTLIVSDNPPAPIAYLSWDMPKGQRIPRVFIRAIAVDPELSKTEEVAAVYALLLESARALRIAAGGRGYLFANIQRTEYDAKKILRAADWHSVQIAQGSKMERMYKFITPAQPEFDEF